MTGVRLKGADAEGGKGCNTKLGAGFNSQSNAMTNKATE